MRESRSSGSVEGVMSNRDPYSDFMWVLQRQLGFMGGPVTTARRKTSVAL